MAKSLVSSGVAPSTAVSAVLILEVKFGACDERNNQPGTVAARDENGSDG